jgi:hypothetical protein
MVGATAGRTAGVNPIGWRPAEHLAATEPVALGVLGLDRDRVGAAILDGFFPTPGRSPQ